MSIQAAMGIQQLKRIEKNWRHRKKIWGQYNKAFKELPCITPKDPEPNTIHAYHLYTLMIDIEKLRKSRDWVLNAITAENIGICVHYIPVHLHPFYLKTYDWKKGDFPNAEWIGERTISLPLSAGLNEKDVKYVIEALYKVITK